MAAITLKHFTIISLALATLMVVAGAAPQEQNTSHDLLDVEAPSFFNYNSPLSKPDSLRSRPYYDFLSTLYRRDSTKSDLFRPYAERSRRSAPEPIAFVKVAQGHSSTAAEGRNRRAIVFRPLFVYKQQEIRKQELKGKKRH